MKTLVSNNHCTLTVQQWWGMNEGLDDLSIVLLNGSIRILNGVLNVRVVVLNVQVAISINT